jgi:hypothetical protein
MPRTRAKIRTLSGDVMLILDCARDRGVTSQSLYAISTPTPTDTEPLLRTEREKPATGRPLAQCITPDGRRTSVASYARDLGIRMASVMKRATWDTDHNCWVIRGLIRGSRAKPSESAAPIDTTLES